MARSQGSADSVDFIQKGRGAEQKEEPSNDVVEVIILIFLHLQRGSGNLNEELFYVLSKAGSRSLQKLTSCVASRIWDCCALESQQLCAASVIQKETCVVEYSPCRETSMVF